MKNLNSFFGAVALMVCIFAVGAAAQTNNGKSIVVEVIEFESINDYAPFGGPSPVNLDYKTFVNKLEAEFDSGESKLVNRTTVAGMTGMETRVGSGDMLVIKNKNNSYTTPYVENLFTVVPELIGGETTETSTIVSANVSYQRATATAEMTEQGLPVVATRDYKSKVSSNVGAISIIGGGFKNPNGSYTYLALRFTR